MKKITIKIEEQDLALLKKNKYALCFSCRERDQGYDVAFSVGADYLMNTTIGFEDAYQVFACRSVTDYEALDISTNKIDIVLGQRITLNDGGSFSKPVSGGEKGSITLNNEYGNIFPGYARKINYGGKGVFLLVFAAPYVSVKGTYTMHPQNVVRVWFEQFAKGQVFVRDFLLQEAGIGRSVFEEVTLTDDGVQLIYQGESWQK